MSLINKFAVRERLLEVARNTRAHHYSRVKNSTLDMLERQLDFAIRGVVARAPSKGKTL